MMSKRVAKLMENYDEERAHKIGECGTYLAFDKIADTGKLKLATANFCRERMCPMCQWRRSLKLAAQADKIFRVCSEKGYQYIFMTLTIRNCSGDALSSTVSRLYEGARKLTNRPDWRKSFAGSYRALEVTYNAQEGTYHPHWHWLLAVRPDYFSSIDYWPQDKLIKRWRAACGLDYDPVVNVERIYQKEGQTITSACVEACKYPAKTAALPDWRTLETIDYALRGRRLLAWGGCLAEVRRTLQLTDIEKDDDLIHADPSELPDESIPIERITYVWRYGLYLPVDVHRTAEEKGISKTA